MPCIMLLSFRVSSGHLLLTTWKQISVTINHGIRTCILMSFCFSFTSHTLYQEKNTKKRSKLRSNSWRQATSHLMHWIAGLLRCCCWEWDTPPPPTMATACPCIACHGVRCCIFRAFTRGARSSETTESGPRRRAGCSWRAAARRRPSCGTLSPAPGSACRPTTTAPSSP
uniref:Uncharacterized protein n=1 Tax=Oryza glumipatula TaxID=40148 RepID=A0A0D9ZRU7_9ORYZ